MKGFITSTGRQLNAVTLLRFSVLIHALLASGALAAPFGTVFFNNRIIAGDAFFSPVYGPEPGNSALALRGNATTNGGIQVYSGALLAGTGYTAALYAGAGVLTDEELLVPQASAPFRTNLTLMGIIQGPNNGVPITVAPAETVVTIQVRAWDNKGGTVTNWEQVIADPSAARGSSALFSVIPRAVPGTPTALVGLESFCLYLPPGAASIVSQPRDTIISVGATAVFSVSVISVTEPSYQWLFNGNAIPDATSTVYAIPSVDYFDGGDYSVVVTASSISQTSRVARLSVQPTIVNLEVERVVLFDVDAIRLTYDSTPNRPVQIEVRSSLRDTWFNTGEFINPSVRGFFYDIAVTNDQRFYRLSVGR